jgi:bifunctional DNase/RNase
MPKNKFPIVPISVLIVLISLSLISLAIISIIDISKYVPANVLRVEDSVIIIGNNCTAVVAETSPERAHSIELGIKGIIEHRPNTHDTFAAVLKSFNITLEAVNIEGFDGRYYYADLLLRKGDKVLKLDTKPSDGIALALRMDSTIYINKTLLSEIGENIC